MKKLQLLSAVCATVACIALPTSVQAVSYTIVDLGTLGGSRSNGLDINDSGHVTGTSQTADGYTHAFLYDGNMMHDLGLLGGTSANGYSINDSGHVTGVSTTGEVLSSGFTVQHAFLYDGNMMHDLGTLDGLPSGVTYSAGHGINDSGHVTGVSTTNDNDGSTHAFLYDGNMMHDLGTLGGKDSYGYGINDSGQVTGVSETTGGGAHAFLYDNDTMQDLGTLGGTISRGYDINASGQVTGYSDIAGPDPNIYRAFLYDGNMMHDLGTLSGNRSAGYGINDSGQVVGEYSYEVYGEELDFFRAFLYDGSNMLDLCVLVDCVSAGWDYFHAASAINNNGDITGIGVIAGEAHAFLLLASTPPTSVTIDIKPSKKPENVIDLKKDKNLKVAIVGTESLDALQVDPATVKFGPSNASPVRFKGQDYNRDGYSDLILTFKLSETGIECNTTSATLTGQTFPDPVIDISGSDIFTVEPPCL